MIRLILTLYGIILLFGVTFCWGITRTWEGPVAAFVGATIWLIVVSVLAALNREDYT